MTADLQQSDAYARGKAYTEATNPGMETALRARYDALLPGLARDLVELNGRTYTRGVLDDKTRELATISALTALGAQTRPQLKIHVAACRKLGASREEIAEVIYQMALYGGMPAMFNALNAAIEVFDAEGEGVA
ncbi:carboxymuconolactone decarboxylase family protein [Pararhodobacter zhoushanensis]|uniref:carboxymuconolactone decarboxylase family protein n=1 Tax=Pararhodobacter zhoushanensis TaxID=2479545 RepID=UPI000F8E6DD8|nr:carboxymuconolactone decarboxylase family protein [Pararhodobacter zhoushanensis]